MTRLVTEWVSPMLDGMTEYNQNLKERTGVDLSGLAAEIFNASEEKMKTLRKEVLVGVVPITQGEGIIGDFAEAVAAIIASMGFRALVTEHTDVDGVYEAYGKGCSILFFADDTRYLALNIAENRAADNNYCTALGYISVLEKMMSRKGKTMAEETILVIGHGIVGKEAVKILKARNLSFCVYDKEETALEDADFDLLSSRDEIKKYEYILDFTNEGRWLRADEISASALYASPGVPCSLDEKAKIMLAKNAVYDNLEIGTAVMLGDAVL